MHVTNLPKFSCFREVDLARGGRNGRKHSTFGLINKEMGYPWK